jgi:RNA polymerase-binding transcription factor DksA
MDSVTAIAARHASLERRRSLLRRASHALQEQETSGEATEADREDQAASRAAVELLDHLSETELMRLQRVQAALDRIETGTFAPSCTCTIPSASTPGSAWSGRGIPSSRTRTW